MTLVKISLYCILKSRRKILNKTNHFRNLGIKIDESPNWKTHVHDLASKLNRANSVLSKLRDFVSSEILRSVYSPVPNNKGREGGGLNESGVRQIT